MTDSGKLPPELSQDVFILKQESIFVEDQHHSLHLRHIFSEKSCSPVLMIHGAIENGKIFYTESGKGLAPFLAQNGFDVFVADLRGRGKSKPSISDNPSHGQHDMICRDIPTLVNDLHQRTGQKIQVITHSWGGVVTSSALVRFAELQNKISSILCFGTKRTISVWNWERCWKVELVWKRLAVWLAKRKGYFAARQYGVGADDETLDSLRDGVRWVCSGPWVDPHDGFDYASASAKAAWPALWHIAAQNDAVLGNPVDVRRFMQECGQASATLTILSRANGNAMDYDHINMLTSSQALDDHFPSVVSWLQQHAENSI